MENLREQKGKVIAQTRIIKRMEDGFAVQSQTSKRFYFVDSNGHCTCPDCEKNMVSKCKHAFAVEYFLTVKKTGLKGQVTEHKVRLTYKQAWHAYTEAQTNELKEFDELLKDLVVDIQEPEYKFGRPALSKKELLFCAIKKVYSMLSSRRAETLFRNAEEKTQISHAPNYNSINILLNDKSITPLLKELVMLSASPLKAVEEKFAIDSTGFRTTKFNEYCKDKHDTKREHQYVKLHAVIGCKTNIITACEVTESEGKGTGDCPFLQPLAIQTANNGFSISEFSADMAYSSRDNIGAIAELGGTAYIPYRSNASGKPRGKTHLWKKMFHYFQFNKEEFMEHYHVRSNVESTFGALKAKFGDCLKAKNIVSQTNELLCKVIAYNIVVVIHEMHELGINADFKQ